MTSTSAHGGNVYRAARELGIPRRKLIDFSASINPLGPSPAARQILRRTADLVHYPDPDGTALRQALGRRWRLDPAQIALGNGSTELIHLLPRALQLRRALILGPTFSEYEQALRLAGATAAYLHAHREERYRPPVEAALKVLRQRRPRHDALFLCNPNSPTGQAVDVEAVRALVNAAAARKVWVVVDETFVDYCPARSVLHDLAQRQPPQNLIVLRSFTKFYALPALRLGWMAAPAPTVERVRGLQPPWSVNMPAQTMAAAALGDRRHEAESLRRMRLDRQTLAAGLSRLPGVTVHPSEGNFLLLELPASLPATRCVRRLAGLGLLLRDCSGVAGLNPSTVRLAVRKPADNRRLLSALRALLKGEAR